ncbi:restriction endonuclease [Gammaproteobacteria bacterium]|nr:restriction endonuclease [Gammaproteobacteria bacterium]
MQTKEEFIDLLTETCSLLKSEAVTNKFKSSAGFENRVREVLSGIISSNNLKLKIDFHSHAQAFPDICLGEYGIEVKFTEKDAFKGVANSISQGMKDPAVKEVYVLWGKMGGNPDVAFKRYEDAVVHVRTSHVPRFEIDMESKSSLFDALKMSYAEFSELNMELKMDLVRAYVRNRLRNGSKTFYWYLESQSVDIGNKSKIRFFTNLDLEEMKYFAAMEIFLFPNLVNHPDSEVLLDERIGFFFNKFGIHHPSVNSLGLFLIQQDSHFNNTHKIIEELKGYMPRVINNLDLATVKRFWTWSCESDFEKMSLLEIWKSEMEHKVPSNKGFTPN